MLLVLKTLAGGLWGLLQLLMPWWFGLPSSDAPYRSRTPCPERKPLPPKKPKTPKAA
jgi:hypothetical protein